MLKCIVTGTGRSGTGLLSEILTEAGINCGHESIFYSDIERQNRKKYLVNKVYQADSSWVAAPFLDSEWLDKDIKIVYLVRDPLKVISSFHDIGFFRTGRKKMKLNKLVYNHTTISPDDQDTLSACVKYYFEWHALIQDRLSRIPNPRMIVRLESLEEELGALGEFLDAPLKPFPQRVNLKLKEKSKIQDRFDSSRAETLIQQYLPEFERGIDCDATPGPGGGNG